MMVPLGYGVEACDSVGVGHPPHEPQVDERVEGSVDGCAGDSTQSPREHVEDLIRRWVVAAVEDLVEHRPTLECHWKTALPASCLQRLEGSLLLHPG